MPGRLPVGATSFFIFSETLVGAMTLPPAQIPAMNHAFGSLHESR